MTDKPDDNKRINDERETEKTEVERKTAIAEEYETLLSQNQDELSIVKALCSKYSLEKEALDEILTEAKKAPSKGPANPAQGYQMGQAPPKGTVQSGKEPKTD